MAPSTAGTSWRWSGPYTLEAVRDASMQARQFLNTHRVPEDHASGWELVLSEAGNNCVLHPGDPPPTGDLEVTLTLHPEEIVLHLTDRTPGFDWPDDPQLPPEDSESGRGLFLIEALTDDRIYARGRHANLLRLSRRLPAPLPPEEDYEATLDAMTEELSACYESLSSIFRFTEEARNARSIDEFARHLLDHLITVTSADLGLLRIVQDQELTCLAHQGVADFAPTASELQAIETRRDLWCEGSDAELLPAGSRTGIIHPFFQEDAPMGSLILARTRSDEPFNAGEVNLIHTFCEFLTQQLLTHRHRQEAIRSSLARHEFELAAAIQRSLLPPSLHPVEGIQVVGHCESALSIGGDFYDLIPCEGTGYFFVIADVMGKGVAASMMAAVTRAIIRTLGEDFDHPGVVLEKVAAQMFEDLDRLEMFVTLAVGIVDVPSGTVRIANAGHAPIVVSNGSLMEAGPLEPPIGIEPYPRFTEHTLSIGPGSRVFAYTDGLTDPRNGRPTFETQDEVAAWFHRETRGITDPEQLKFLLLQHLGYHPTAAPLADDQTFILLTLPH
ncbi:serine phosphatase RsbU (regulator of sigma subunit)/anti-sigma regulatory factor (Ser/Thr protein kinase) [Haloferula luteola]|uniref:Serine phosphatase RsbU (Regulator of sigma subunit)/anti-sigma regulatory factor (Ser/Thr protein kinase) n=1 Tax=Haloferula luteola TaxID=595692 RepID=A0A840V0N1_9BACT|nr:SpoIIE family protein phosphatase [Haloferula luteola]MBB5350883.1 serine phosphatase RsbU (regulator of sigma subunit)/anti-sigma regulatory factor (Ser/Thr protein kinase) [Haloferula luteola]